jgi:hypothetical protein
MYHCYFFREYFFLLFCAIMKKFKLPTFCLYNFKMVNICAKNLNIPISKGLLYSIYLLKYEKHIH